MHYLCVPRTAKNMTTTFMLNMASPVGPLTLEATSHALVGCWFGLRATADVAQNTAADKILAQAATQLDEYFAGQRRAFDIPLQMDHFPASAFRRQCWDVLRTIPYGHTINYGEMARRIGNPKASRAVGGANHHNPISIIVPCHRVIGANGSLTGFGGGMDAKKWLLTLEGAL